MVYDYIEQRFKQAQQCWGKQDVTPEWSACRWTTHWLTKWYLKSITTHRWMQVVLEKQRQKVIWQQLWALPSTKQRRAPITIGTTNVLDVLESTEELSLRDGVGRIHEIELLSRAEVVAITLIGEDRISNSGKQRGRHYKANLESRSRIYKKVEPLYPAWRVNYSRGCTAEKPANFKIVTVGEGSRTLSQKHQAIFRPHSVWISDTTETVAVTFTGPWSVQRFKRA